MSKEIYADKVKINRMGLIFFIIGFIFLIIAGIYLINGSTDNQDRIGLFGYILLGVAGYHFVENFNMIYSNIKPKKKKKKKNNRKIDKKKVNKLAKNIVFLLLFIQLMNMGLAFLLAGTSLSNLEMLLIYFPVAAGSNIFIVVMVVIIFIWKNKFSIKEILKKVLKNSKEMKGGNEKTKNE